jgi:hypothetical protein
MFGALPEKRLAEATRELVFFSTAFAALGTGAPKEMVR